MKRGEEAEFDDCERFADGKGHWCVKLMGLMGHDLP